MRKLFSFILCAVMVLSLFSGCSGEGSKETTAAALPHSLKVGFGRIDITPDSAIPLGGYQNAPDQRLHYRVSDPIYATCIAFSDETGTTALIFHLDLINTGASQLILAKRTISKSTGIPAANIHISSTHTHSAPNIVQDTLAVIDKYNQKLGAWMIEAAQAALEDRKEAEIYAAEAYPVGYNFVRHYVLEDGTVIGDGFGVRDGRAFDGHVSEADNQLQLLKIVREGGEDIVLMNWQTHPQIVGMASKPDLSADIVGSIRMYMEENLGCKFAYFTGASGNINPFSRIGGEEAYPEDDYMAYGRQLGQIAIDALKNCVPVEKGSIQLLTDKIVLETNSASTRDVSLSALAIGDLGFVFAPYEMFDTNGVEIKTGSKFTRTFVVCYANGHLGYIPSIGTYDYARPTDKDQVYEITKCSFTAGAGEKLAEKFVSMLNQLYETKE